MIKWLMRNFFKRISPMFLFFPMACAPLIVPTHSVEYVYENQRVEVNDPSWATKTVFAFEGEDPRRPVSAEVYENGDETVVSAFLLYEYWDLEEISNAAVDRRLRRIERYSDADIFTQTETGRVKDPEKTAEKLISYDVYETDEKNGRTISLKKYYYNTDDPVIENRNVPMTSIEYEYFSGADRFLPQTERHFLFLANEWIYRASAEIEYSRIAGEKRPTAKRFYLSEAADFYEIEVYTYSDSGDLTRRELYTAEEYAKSESQRVPKKTVLYVTEER